MDAPPVQYVRTSDGYDIAYTVSGAGRPLVNMPPPFSHATLLWQHGSIISRWMQALASRFRLIHYDGRGQGLSTRGLPEWHSLDDCERDLEAVLRRTQPGRVVLYAPIWMGHVAIRYAEKHPETVRALVLWNCRLEGLTRVSQMMGGGNGPTSDAWDFFLESMARTNQRHEDPAIATHRSRESVTHQDWLVQQGAIAKSSIAAIAQRLDVPTLLLSASAGAWPSGVEQGSRQLAALIPNSRLVLFDDAGAGIFAPEGGTPAAIPVIEAFLAEVVPLARPLGVGEGLSLRELEVLRLVAAGKSNQEIADELVISRNTVRRHVSHIFDKTGVANRAQAVAYARDHRIT